MGQESGPFPKDAKGRQSDPSATVPAAPPQDKADAATVALINFSPTPDVESISPASKIDAATPARRRVRRWAVALVARFLFSPTQAVESISPASKINAAIPARRRVRRWAIALVALCLFSLVLLWLGPRLYHKFIAWRAAQFALQGEELIRKNQVEDAIPYIRSAYTLSPRTPEVLRAMAQLLTVFSSPAAPNYWNWLLQTTDATDDDRRAAIDCAMQYGLFDKAWSMIKDLLARNGGDSRNQLLAARWSAERGTPPQTMVYATRAADDDPINKAAILFLAAQELANPYLHQDAVNSLLRIVGSDDEFGLQALQQAVLDPNLKPADIDRIIAQLHSHPLGDESERVDTLVLEIRRHPEQREILIDRAVAAHQSVKPDDLALFCEWLNNNNEAPRVLKLIPREKALSNKSLCFAYLDCLAVLKRWDDIKNILSGATVPLEVPLVELYLSSCAHEMGDDRGSDLHWQEAVAAAQYNPVESLHLAVYAESHGQNERAADVYRALTHEPGTARIAYLGLMRVFSDKDFQTQCDLLDQIVSRWPHDPKLASKDILLHLLLNQRVPEMHERAVSLLADDSYNLSLRTNVALACLRLNDPAGALQAYHYAVIDWNTAPVADRVVYAATLNANGHGKAAHLLLVLVDRRTLQPEFRDLIKSIP